MQKTLDISIHWVFKSLELLIVLCMLAMVIMVFGNVVLRYAFNTGITISDEMSRYCFIWLTYIGAMLAMREKGHLGVDTLVKHFGLLGKKICLFLSEAIMLGCNVLFFIGTFKMHDLQVTNISPVVGMSMIWVFGIGYIVAVVMGIMNVNVIYRLLTGQLSEAELVQVIETEGLADAEKQLHGASHGASSGVRA